MNPNPQLTHTSIISFHILPYLRYREQVKRFVSLFSLFRTYRRINGSRYGWHWLGKDLSCGTLTEILCESSLELWWRWEKKKSREGIVQCSYVFWDDTRCRRHMGIIEQCWVVLSSAGSSLIHIEISTVCSAIRCNNFEMKSMLQSVGWEMS